MDMSMKNTNYSTDEFKHMIGFSPASTYSEHSEKTKAHWCPANLWIIIVNTVIHYPLLCVWKWALFNEKMLSSFHENLGEHNSSAWTETKQM